MVAPISADPVAVGGIHEGNRTAVSMRIDFTQVCVYAHRLQQGIHVWVGVGVGGWVGVCVYPVAVGGMHDDNSTSPSMRIGCVCVAWRVNARARVYEGVWICGCVLHKGRY